MRDDRQMKRWLRTSTALLRCPGYDFTGTVQVIQLQKISICVRRHSTLPNIVYQAHVATASAVGETCQASIRHRLAFVRAPPGCATGRKGGETSTTVPSLEAQQCRLHISACRWWSALRVVSSLIPNSFVTHPCCRIERYSRY